MGCGRTPSTPNPNPNPNRLQRGDLVLVEREELGEATLALHASQLLAQPSASPSNVYAERVQLLVYNSFSELRICFSEKVVLACFPYCEISFIT